MGELASYIYTLHTLTKLKLHSKHNHKNTDDGREEGMSTLMQPL